MILHLQLHISGIERETRKIRETRSLSPWLLFPVKSKCHLLALAPRVISTRTSLQGLQISRIKWREYFFERYLT